MLRFSALLLTAAFVVSGCQDADDRVQAEWTNVQSQASRWTADTSKEALEAGKDKLIDLQSEIANAKLPPEVERIKMDSVKVELQKVGAALDMRKIQEDLDKRVRQAQSLKENAGKTVDEIKADLSKADDAYRDLQQRLASAQQVYEETSRRAKSAWDAISGRDG